MAITAQDPHARLENLQRDIERLEKRIHLAPSEHVEEGNRLRQRAALAQHQLSQPAPAGEADKSILDLELEELKNAFHNWVERVDAQQH
jgi:hypothetical protein